MSKNSLFLTDDQESTGIKPGLDALRRSPSFRGPVESFEDRGDSNEHLALLYETKSEQLGAVVPFIKQGLERGDRCLYITDENSITTVVTALRESDTDVDAALDSGALTLHTPQDTYFRNGEFDSEEMFAFLETRIEEALDEYEGFRSTGEMSWVLGEGAETEDLVEYETIINRLYAKENCIGLCQYNRERFPAAVLADVVRAHPHLIYDSTVCHNYYYTPPEEFFGPRQPEREVERMVETLRERTQAVVQLRDHDRRLRRQNDRLESFASLVAHELRNPVTIGQIYSKQLSDDADADAVEHVADAFDRIEDMIDILLVVTREEAVVSDETPVELGNAAHIAWANAETDEARLEVRVDKMIQADETHIEHLFRNLFENAVEHGGADTVSVGTLPTGFYVADDGTGIPADKRNNVFKIGYTTAADHGGTGVGLTFVSELAEMYGLTVTMTESDAGGARFEFTDGPTAERS